MATELVKTAPVLGRVLIVDDDPTVSDVVRRYLERAGFVVDQAGDGAAGLVPAATRPSDLVVLDVIVLRREQPTL